MNDFNSEDFKKLFERIYLFEDVITGFETKEEASPIEDNFDGKDITYLMDLPIFSQLNKISFGNHINIRTYVTIEKNNKIIGARGILGSHTSAETPEEISSLFYEYGHEIKNGKPIDYVKEFNMDAAILYVLEKLDHRPKEDKGSELGHKIIKKVIENTEPDDFGITAEIKPRLKYKCLIEAENFDVWKVGIPKKGYQLILTGENLVQRVNTASIKYEYLSRNKLEEVTISNRKDNTDVPEINLNDEGQIWFWKGTEKLADTKDDIIYNNIISLFKETGKANPHVLYLTHEALEKELDLSKEKIPLLVKGLSIDMNIPDTVGKIENIYSVITTYDKLVDLFKNPQILSIEASKSIKE